MPDKADRLHIDSDNHTIMAPIFNALLLHLVQILSIMTIIRAYFIWSLKNMFRFLPSTLKGILASVFYGINTIFWCIPIMAVAVLKLIIPFSPWRKLCSTVIMWFADLWVLCNSISMWNLNKIAFNVTGDTELNPNDWYLVIANHQSWVDIITMQHILRGKIPFLKFFLKQELVYIPFIGLAWWALDFPFMKRFSKSQLRKKPHLKGKDIDATRKACEKFKTQPISVVNFVEGTRFTDKKNKHQGQPFKHLLKPRSGGAGYVMTLLGKQIHNILNLTISYPDHHGYYWSFVTGKITEVNIHIEAIPVTETQRGNYIEDKKFRATFQIWLNTIWQEKDQKLAKTFIDNDGE